MEINKKALIVGINYYQNAHSLNGCVNDALSVANILKNNDDGSPNFCIQTMVANDSKTPISCGELKNAIKDLFNGNDSVALFYFSGHGYADEDNYGYINTSDCDMNSILGVSMDFILQKATASQCKNKIIILDCCYAGKIGAEKYFNKVSEIGEGVTILSACKQDQYAEESTDGIENHGVFTDLLVGALQGGGVDVVGHITPGGIYAYIDRALGPWNQRPVFKTNVETFVSLREAVPPLEKSALRKIRSIFVTPNMIYPLNPSYEFTEPNANPNNVKIFKILQKMVNVNLVVPDGEDYMYFAALHSKGCKLTPLGKHYWDLVDKNYI